MPTLTPMHSRLLRRRAALSLLGTLPGALLLPACGRKAATGQAVPAGATVLALGDSLTFGTGATPETAYPVVLARLTGWNVVNAGVPGHTAAQALERTQPLLDEHKPALVLLGIGGNDFLRRQDEAATKASIERIVRTVQGSGAQLLLIGVPRPTLAAKFTGSLTDHPLYGELAEALAVPLHRQGWAEVLADESLKADAIHANAAGYERFAQGLLATLRATQLFKG
jgi:acyl-CoA thioesterase I